jgi:hypothetical protein
MATPSKRPARRLPPKDLDETDIDEPTTNGDDDEEEEDERPARGSKSRGVTEAEVQGGWLDAQAKMEATSSYAQSLKLEEKVQVIKFLEDTPYANFLRHWVERTTKDGKTLRAYGCPKTIKKPCPLCEVGDRAQAVAAFNIAIVDNNGDVLHKSWDVGPRLFAVLRGYANDPKVGPLTKGFFIASKTGKRGTVQHNVAPVSRTALEEDYDITPPDKEDLDNLELYTPKIIEIAKRKDLEELAEEMSDEYE